MVAWQDNRSVNYDIYSARINTSGAVLDPAGVVVSAGATDELSPCIATQPGAKATGDSMISYSHWDAGNQNYRAGGRSYFDDPTAVGLVYLDAEAVQGGIVISWGTAEEINNAGFNVWRADQADGPYEIINPSMIPAEGDPLHGADYEYTDNGVKSGKTFFYKLEDVDTNGNSNMNGPVSATALFPNGVQGKK